jgi:hypothetical protein
VTAPVHAQFTTVTNVPPNIGASKSIGSDTQVNLFTNGSIGNSFNAGDSNGSSTNIEVNIFGGTVGTDFDAYNGSTINISGGTIGTEFEAYSGSTVIITAGTIGNSFDALSGSTVFISGGTLGTNNSLSSGSAVTISGGTIERASSASNLTITGGTINGLSSSGTLNIYSGRIGDFRRSGGVANIYGGSFGHYFDVEGGETTLHGGEFRLDGVPIDGLVMEGDLLQFNVPDDAVLSGILSDGRLLRSCDRTSTTIRRTIFSMAR